MWGRKKTKRELIDRLRETANLKTFATGPGVKMMEGEKADDFARRITLIYLQTWMNPALDEIEERWIKPKAEANHDCQH